MEIKLFGKSVFEFKKRGGDTLFFNSQQSLENSKFLPDFNTFRENQSIDYAYTEMVIPTGKIKFKDEKDINVIKVEKTPKNIYELKLLNDNNFKINIDKEYVDSQIKEFKDKLNLIKIVEFDMSRGANEIASVIIRLENRKKYGEHESFFSEYAYTTNTKISEVIEKHSNLQLGKIEQFIADMPKEAVDIMKLYTKETEEICKKKPIFYIIADKKDFKQTNKRRDPILLAQSPFGHFWQILGAWDKEMMFLEEL